MTPYCPHNHWKITGNNPQTHIFPDIASKMTWQFCIFSSQIPIFTKNTFSTLYAENWKIRITTFFLLPLFKAVKQQHITCKVIRPPNASVPKPTHISQSLEITLKLLGTQIYLQFPSILPAAYYTHIWGYLSFQYLYTLYACLHPGPSQ